MGTDFQKERRFVEFPVRAGFARPCQYPLFGQGSTLSELSTQALPAFVSLLAGAACRDKPDEAQPRPN
jgi:hypothetical protein